MSDKREQQAINAITAFSVYAHDKLPAHVVEDLRIIAGLAKRAIEVTPSSNEALLREALIDWRNCWLCPETDFDKAVPRLLRVTDTALNTVDEPGD